MSPKRINRRLLLSMPIIAVVLLPMAILFWKPIFDPFFQLSVFKDASFYAFFYGLYSSSVANCISSYYIYYVRAYFTMESSYTFGSYGGVDSRRPNPLLSHLAANKPTTDPFTSADFAFAVLDAYCMLYPVIIAKTA